MCVSWLYHVCCIPIAYSFHGYFIDVTWLFYLCLIAVSSLCHLSFILVQYLSYTSTIFLLFLSYLCLISVLFLLCCFPSAQCRYYHVAWSSKYVHTRSFSRHTVSFQNELRTAAKNMKRISPMDTIRHSSPSFAHSSPIIHISSAVTQQLVNNAETSLEQCQTRCDAHCNCFDMYLDR